MVAAAVASGVLVLAACALLAFLIYKRWTLPDRVAAEVRRAQWALLEPTHEERVILADRGEISQRATQFATSAAAALAAYDRALALMPERVDVRREREVVACAYADLRGTAQVVAESGRDRATIAVSSVPLPPHLATDRRLRGLHAFLIGDARACHAAWADLDLAPLAPDPLVDAAAGQLHLARDEPAKAYPRLLRAFDVWPDAGFLAVAIADCAVRLGDLAKAEQYLARGEQLVLKDPFDTHVRVRADLRAAQGRSAEARADYEWLLEHHAAITALEHFAALLEREGDLGQAVDLFLHLVETQPDRDRYATRLRGLAERWWTALPMMEQVAEVLSCWNRIEPPPRLRRLAHVRQVLVEDSQETHTGKVSSASSVLHRRLGSRLTLPTEFAVLTSRESYLVSRARPTFQRLAAAILLATESAAGRRIAEHAPGLWQSVRLGTWPCVMAVGWIYALFASDLRAQVRWMSPTPSGPPMGRYLASGTFDTARSSTLMYGGYDATSIFDDFWSWNGTRWSLIAQHAAPGPRYSSVLVEEGSSSVCLFGGWNGTVATNDTRRWNGIAWTRLNPTTSPPHRYSSALAYDSDRGVAVMFGGNGGNNLSLADTWEWNGMTWTDRTPMAGSPPRVKGHRLVYDPIRHRVVLFGGQTDNGSTYHNTTWEWNGSQWTQATPSAAPCRRAFFGMAWDARRACAVVFGGSDGSSYFNDIWEWDGNNWTQRTPEPCPVPPCVPSARWGAVFVYDSANRQSVLFSGQTATLAYPADTWILEPKNGRHADYTTTGPGCPGTQGTPVLAAAPGSLPWIGHTFTANVTSLPNFGPVSLFLLGFSNPNVPALFCRPDCTLRAFPDLITQLAVSGNQATWSIPIPNDCNLLGFNQLFTQVVVFNFATGCVDAMSNGMQMTIGAR